MQKISEEKMNVSKVFHIYLKDHCVSHNLTERQFKSNWELLNNLVGIMKTDYKATDLSSEMVEYNREDSEGSY